MGRVVELVGSGIGLASEAISASKSDMHTVSLPVDLRGVYISKPAKWQFWPCLERFIRLVDLVSDFLASNPVAFMAALSTIPQPKYLWRRKERGGVRIDRAIYRLHDNRILRWNS